MSARTETLGAGSHDVRLAWYAAVVALLLLITAIVATRPRSTAEPVARPNVAVEAPTEAGSPGASAEERTAVRRPFVRLHGAGDFRGTVKSAADAAAGTTAGSFGPIRPGAFRGQVKGGSDEPARWSAIASAPTMVGSVFCGSCG